MAGDIEKALAEIERLRAENIGMDQERTIREMYVSKIETDLMELEREIERLRADLAECRRLLREAVTACECGVWGPCFSRVEVNEPRVEKWIEAAKAAGGDDDE